MARSCCHQHLLRLSDSSAKGAHGPASPPALFRSARARHVAHVSVLLLSGAYQAHDAAGVAAALEKGAFLLKYCRRRSPHVVHVEVHADGTLHCVSSARRLRVIRFVDIVNIVAGQTTAVFGRLPGQHDPRLCFSVLYREGNADRTLDLVCKDADEFALWHDGLHAAVSRQRLTTVATTCLREEHVAPVDLQEAHLRSSRLSSALALPPPPPPPPGDVFLWGCHTDLAPARPGDRAQLQPALVPRTAGLDAVAVSLGSAHGAMLSRGGQVFTWGAGAQGRLGHGRQLDTPAPVRVAALAAEVVTQLACGDASCAAVTADGRLLAWGATTLLGPLGPAAAREQFEPHVVPLPIGLRVRQVALGPWHGALVSTGGALFTWGEGTFGALGHGDCTASPQPRPVAALASLSALQVACGVWHTAALARGGGEGEGGRVQLFLWGDGDKGQLGNGRKGVVTTPAPTGGELAAQTPKQVACGAHHTVVLTAIGGVYVTGRDSQGGPSRATFAPVQGALAGGRAGEVACGDHHTAVVASQRRRLYTWGTGAGGRLGHGDVKNCDAPCLVERLLDRDLRQVVCGPQSTAVVVGMQLLSVEQKAAVARSRDVGRSASVVTLGSSHLPPAAPAERPRAHSSVDGQLSTRSELLLASTQAAGHAPPMPAVASSWRARALQAEVEALRRELAAAEAAKAALQAELEASEARAAQLTRQLEAGAATASQSGKELPMYVNALYENGNGHSGSAGGDAGTGAQDGDCVEECEPGVFVTISAGKVLRRVRFDKRRFSDEQAQEWWSANRQRVMTRLALVLPNSRSRRTQSADLTHNAL